MKAKKKPTAPENKTDVGHSAQKAAPEKCETGNKESVVVIKETGGVKTTEKSSAARMQHGEMGVEAAEPMEVVASCAGNEEKLTTPEAVPENSGEKQPPSGSDETRPAETTAVHKGMLKTRKTARCVKTWSVVLFVSRACAEAGAVSLCAAPDLSCRRPP